MVVVMMISGRDDVGYECDDGDDCDVGDDGGGDDCGGDDGEDGGAHDGGGDGTRTPILSLSVCCLQNAIIIQLSAESSCRILMQAAGRCLAGRLFGNSFS